MLPVLLCVRVCGCCNLLLFSRTSCLYTFAFVCWCCCHCVGSCHAQALTNLTLFIVARLVEFSTEVLKSSPKLSVSQSSSLANDSDFPVIFSMQSMPTAAMGNGTSYSDPLALSGPFAGQGMMSLDDAISAAVITRYGTSIDACALHNGGTSRRHRRPSRQRLRRRTPHTSAGNSEMSGSSEDSDPSNDEDDDKDEEEFEYDDDEDSAEGSEGAEGDRFLVNGFHRESNGEGGSEEEETDVQVIGPASTASSGVIGEGSSLVNRQSDSKIRPIGHEKRNSTSGVDAEGNAISSKMFVRLVKWLAQNSSSLA